MMDISRLSTEDHHENSSQDEDEDSDDNFLYIPPSISAPRQDSSPVRSQSPSQSSKSPIKHTLESGDSSPTYHSGFKKLKYTLDHMVQHNNAQDKKDAGLANLQESLLHDVVKGGIFKMIEDDEERQQKLLDGDAIKLEGRDQEAHDEALESGNLADAALLPEHEETLQQYAIENERIATLHPGEEVFCNAEFGKLFRFPVDLTLSGNPDAMEKLVKKSSQEELEELLMSRTILDMYLVKRCPDSVMLWLLHLLSVCDSVMTVGMIFDTMWSLMNSSQHLHPTAKSWCPSLLDIATIFVNYGASLDSLLPPSLVQKNFTQEDVTQRWKQDKKEADQSSLQTKPSCFLAYNIQQVIKIITQCLVSQNRRPSLSQEDLISLTYLVCKVSLDKQLVRCPFQTDFQHCLAAILSCCHHDTWKTQASKICQIVSQCSEHHHNLVHVIRLMRTSTNRGKAIYPLLSRVCLEKFISKSDSEEPASVRDIEKVEVSDLIPLVAAIKPRQRTDVDFYKLHSLVRLVELAIGFEKKLHKSSDKEALMRLVMMLRDMAGDIRESHKHLCRTQVKDLIIRVASELDYLEQTLTSSKQAFLHNFMKYEQITDSKTINSVEDRCHGNDKAEDVDHENKDNDDNNDDNNSERDDDKMTER